MLASAPITSAPPTEAVPPAGPGPLMEALQNLPVTVHWVFAAAAAIGIVLWLAGHHFVKPAFALVGLCLGAMGGFFLLPLAGWATISGLPTPHVGLVFGGILGLTVGLLLVRVVLAINCAIILALAGILAASVVLHFSPTPTRKPVNTDGIESVLDINRQVDETKTDTQNKVVEQTLDPTVQNRPLEEIALESAQERVVIFIEEAKAESLLIWRQLPGRDRVAIGTAALLGAGLGVFAGIFLPKKSAMIATAFIGAGIWLPNVVWLLHAFNVRGHEALAKIPPSLWLLMWPVFGAIGMWFQHRTAKKSKES